MYYVLVGVVENHRKLKVLEVYEFLLLFMKSYLQLKQYFLSINKGGKNVAVNVKFGFINFQFFENQNFLPDEHDVHYSNRESSTHVLYKMTLEKSSRFKLLFDRLQIIVQ